MEEIRKIEVLKILRSLFEKYKNENWVLTKDQVFKKINSFFPGKWGVLKKDNRISIYSGVKYGLSSGVILLKNSLEIFNKNGCGGPYYPDDGKNVVYYKNWDSLKILGIEILDTKTIKVVTTGFRFKKDDYEERHLKIELTEPEIQFIKEFIDSCYLQWVEIKEEEERKKKNKKRQVELLKKSKNSLLKEFDKDGNGEVDVIEGNDFNTLLKKYQKDIVQVDRKYVQQFIKVSSYLKTKERNIQSIFNSIKDIPNQKVLNKYVKILKVEIRVYNLVLFNSLNMIVSLVEDDMVTFYEIYEEFDSINIFDSQHEKDVSKKLTKIKGGLDKLMNEIRDMGNKISDSIFELSYVTEESNKQLSDKLSEIDSSIKVGNLIGLINTYQNYKTNKRLKHLK